MTAAVVACGGCGVGCPSTSGEVIEQRIPVESPTGRVLRQQFVRMTRCPTCARRRAAAAAVVQAHPRMAAQLGDRRAVEAVEGVDVALALLGPRAPTVTADVTDADLGLWVRHHGKLGITVQWRTAVTDEGQAPPFA